MPTVLVEVALGKYRAAHALRDMRQVPRADGDADQMTQADGLTHLEDGPGDQVWPARSPSIPPKAAKFLWAITSDAFIYAPEQCAFGAN